MMNANAAAGFDIRTWIGPPPDVERTVCAPFKGRGLGEVLDKAAELQALAARAGLAEHFELHARYDIEKGQWAGQLCSCSAPLRCSFYDNV